MLYTPIYRGNAREYCGPTAMAAVTGEPLAVIRDAIREVRGKRAADGDWMPITGLSNSELVNAMIRLGWLPVEKVETDNNYSRHDKFTFGNFLQVHGYTGPFIVNVTNHYIAVSNGEVCDTHTRIPIEIKRWKRARPGRWVKRWWRFAKIDDQVPCVG